MKYYDWSAEKNKKLKIEREVSFEECISVMEEENGLLDTVANNSKYPNQKIFVIRINDYVYLVPFVEDEEKVFLKTIIPSRKATKKYIFNVKRK